MSGPVLLALLAAGLAVVVTRRRRVAVALVTAQALALTVVVLVDADGDRGALLAAGSLLVRALALGALLLWVVLRTRLERPVPAGVAPLVRAGAAIVLALLLAALVPEVGLDSREVEVAALALVAFGLVTAATRRSPLFAVTGFVLVENGVALAATAIPGGGNTIIELGAAVDLLVVALVAVVLHARIVETFGVADTRLLRDLRD
jgi:hydrogenase-4 membrane subunit HyfE